jgi:hypothetical protein
MGINKWPLGQYLLFLSSFSPCFCPIHCMPTHGRAIRGRHGSYLSQTASSHFCPSEDGEPSPSHTPYHSQPCSMLLTHDTHIYTHTHDLHTHQTITDTPHPHTTHISHTHTHTQTLTIHTLQPTLSLLDIFLPSFFVCLFCHTGVWTQGLLLAR